MPLLTDAQLHAIRQIIADHHAAFVANYISPDALPPEVLARLQEQGLISIEGKAIEDAYLYGMVIAAAQDPTVATMGLDQFREYMKRSPMPLSSVERRAMEYAQHQAGQYAVGLGAQYDVVAGQTIITAAKAIEQERMRGSIRDLTTEALAKRKAFRGLVHDLRWATGDMTRNWDRIAVTELHNAHQHGMADDLVGRFGDEVRVAKVPRPTACDHCKRLHLVGGVGPPRVFKLSELQANGTNFKKKVAEWQAVVGGVHPNCQCDLVRVPDGWGFDENWDLVPEGYRADYDTADEIERAIRAEDDLRKAIRVEDNISFQGIPVAIENRRGTVRSWKTPEGDVGKTRMHYAYGYAKRTSGDDEDDIDVYVGPDPQSKRVFVVNQLDATTGRHDETKCFLGFSSEGDAKLAYLSHIDDPEKFGGILAMDIDGFKRWLGTTQPAPGHDLGAQPLTISLQKAKLSPMAQTALAKGGGPFIGPRGGKWADPQHTIPWRDDESKNPYGAYQPRKQASWLKGKAWAEGVARSAPPPDKAVDAVEQKIRMEFHDLKPAAIGRMVDSLYPVPAQHRIGSKLQQIAESKSGVVIRSTSAVQKLKETDPFWYGVYQHGAELKGGVTGGQMSAWAQSEKTRIGDLYMDLRSGASLEKAGPYIGPRGGKWADVKHTIPWASRGVEPGSNLHVRALQEHLKSHFGVELSLYNKRGNLHAEKLIVPKNAQGGGIGSAVYDVITRYADTYGKTIAATPSTEFGSSEDRLIEFHRRLGFVPNRGADKDLNTSESMIRRPVLQKGEARGGKYIRREPYTDGKGKRKWRYWYTESAAAREVTAGTELRLGQSMARVVEVKANGQVILSLDGKRRVVAPGEWHDLLHTHYGDTYAKSAERRAQQVINAVLRHVPRALLEDLKGTTDAERLAELSRKVPEVYAKLAASFRRAGMSPYQAKRSLGIILERRGWQPEARALVIGTVIKHRTIGTRDLVSASESLARGQTVTAGHVATVVELRTPAGNPVAFTQVVAGVARQAEKELAALSAQLAQAHAARDRARPAANALAMALGADALQKLHLLSKAFPGLRDQAIEDVQKALTDVAQVAPSRPATTEGAETVVFVSGEGGRPEPLAARYRLVEAESLIASHDPDTFARHKQYPADVQERAYHRDKAEQAKVIRNAQRMDPRFVVNTNPDSVNGPPMVLDNGVVLGGNSRAMSMQRIYTQHPEKAAEMREYLKAHAHEVGFTADDIGALQNPVLIREVNLEDRSKKSLQLTVRQMNESFTQAMDPRTMQVAMGRRLTDDTITALGSQMGEDDTLNSFLSSASKSQGFVNALFKAGVIDNRNINQYMQKGSRTLNEDGKQLVARILVGRTVDDADVLSNTGAQMLSSIARAVPFMSLATATAGPDYDLGPDLATAIDAFNALQHKVDVGTLRNLDPKMSEPEVHKLLDNQFRDMFGDSHPVVDSPKASALLSLLIRKRGPIQLSRIFREYARIAKQNPTGQGAMFGAATTGLEALQAAEAGEAKGAQGDLLAASMPMVMDLEKAGYFVGPRGGKWADPQHTIPWNVGAKDHGWKPQMGPGFKVSGYSIPGTKVTAKREGKVFVLDVGIEGVAPVKIPAKKATLDTLNVVLDHMLAGKTTKGGDLQKAVTPVGGVTPGGYTVSLVNGKREYTKKGPKRTPANDPEAAKYATLAQAEESIRHEPYEHAVVFSRGKFLEHATSGLVGEVYFTPRLAHLMKKRGDCVFTHNHPAAGMLSKEDITATLGLNLAEMRAVGPDGNGFAIKRPRRGWRAESVIDEVIMPAIEDGYRRGHYAAMGRMDAYIVDRGGTAGSDALPYYNEEVWKGYRREETFKAANQALAEVYRDVAIERITPAKPERHPAKRDDARPKPGPRRVPATGPKGEQLRLFKAGPFVGPRGGLWADPQHTIAWDAKAHAPTAVTPQRQPVAPTWKRMPAEGMTVLTALGATLKASYSGYNVSTSDVVARLPREAVAVESKRRGLSGSRYKKQKRRARVSSVLGSAVKAGLARKQVVEGKRKSRKGGSLKFKDTLWSLTDAGRAMLASADLEKAIRGGEVPTEVGAWNSPAGNRAPGHGTFPNFLPGSPDHEPRRAHPDVIGFDPAADDVEKRKVRLDLEDKAGYTAPPPKGGHTVEKPEMKYYIGLGGPFDHPGRDGVPVITTRDGQQWHPRDDAGVDERNRLTADLEDYDAATSADDAGAQRIREPRPVDPNLGLVIHERTDEDRAREQAERKRLLENQRKGRMRPRNKVR